MFGVRFKPAAGGGNADAVADGGEDILERPARRRVIKRLRRRDKGKTVPPRFFAQPFFLSDFFVPPMARNHRVELVAEGVAQIARNFFGIFLSYQQASIAAQQRDQPRGMAADFIPRDGALAFWRAQPADGDKTAQIGVAGAILGKKDDNRSIVDGDLRAGDEAEADFARPHMRPHDSIDTVAVGES